jgi:hypothetical protein
VSPEDRAIHAWMVRASRVLERRPEFQAGGVWEDRDLEVHPFLC